MEFSTSVKYREVEAGGGLVTNASGEVLMILRNGVWDLPKGHREEGELIDTTALREVQEETGLHGLVCGPLICVTTHSYDAWGFSWMKHTSWFRMFSQDSGKTVPQTDEGISEVRWIPADELAPYLENTYATIREVFAKSGITPGKS